MNEPNSIIRTVDHEGYVLSEHDALAYWPIDWPESIVSDPTCYIQRGECGECGTKICSYAKSAVCANCGERVKLT